jgi:hypothetical protein
MARMLLLLDGVAWERLSATHARGSFAAFHAPARLISVFPTLTDPAYDSFFGTGPTPGYEAGHFDRARNRLHFGLLDYVRGRNEAWVRHCDYRLNFIEDAIMYLFPRQVFHSELRRARKVLERRLAAGAEQVTLYLLSTDGLGHMLKPGEIENELALLSTWIDQIAQDYPGLEIVMLSDHGIGTVPAGCPWLERFDLAGVLTEAGLHLAARLAQPGDVVLPALGLLDVARLHTFDALTTERVVAALRDRPEIELIATKNGDRIVVSAGRATGVIRAKAGPANKRWYSYESQAGDPLELASALSTLAARGALHSGNFASAEDWLNASADCAYSSAPVRLWEGMCGLCREQPDVIVSLTERWYTGSGLLSKFVKMQGTHGGLHRRVSETFAMATGLDFPSPTDLAQVAAQLRAAGWQLGRD